MRCRRPSRDSSIEDKQLLGILLRRRALLERRLQNHSRKENLDHSLYSILDGGFSTRINGAWAERDKLRPFSAFCPFIFISLALAAFTLPRCQVAWTKRTQIDTYAVLIPNREVRWLFMFLSAFYHIFQLMGPWDCLEVKSSAPLGGSQS